jgi:uncharacterized protein YbaP (TraB family)
MKAIKQFIYLIIICNCPFSVNGQAIENALLWKIQGNGLKKTSYILGTYHLVNNVFLNNLKGCELALKKTSSVLGELEITSEVASQMMPYMLMENSSIDSLMNPLQYDSLSQFVQEQLGLPMVLFNKMKPMGIYLMLSAAEMKNTPFLSNFKGEPMDVYVQNEARKNGKDVFALETIQDQADLLFSHVALNEQVQLLMQYIKAGKQGSSFENDRMNNCYMNQELNCLDSLMNASGFTAIESNLLLKDRNTMWIPRIEEIIQKQSCFIAVGALHLAGENGLIFLLRKKGYTLSPVHNRKDVN